MTEQSELQLVADSTFKENLARKPTPQGAGKVCPKCRHVRTGQENVPDWQCPNCGVAYDKVGTPARAPHPARRAQTGSRQPEADPDESARAGRIRIGSFPQMVLVAVLLMGGVIGWKLHANRQAAIQKSEQARAVVRQAEIDKAKGHMAMEDQFQQALALGRSGRQQDAIPAFTPLAEAGHPRAMLMLGRAYMTGPAGTGAGARDQRQEPKQDLNQAMAWFRKAAEAGNSLGLVWMGQVDELRRENPSALEAAANDYLLAARLGDAAGLFCLARAHELGLGVPKDAAKAYAFYAIAAKSYELNTAVSADAPHHRSGLGSAASMQSIRPVLDPLVVARADEQAARWKPGDALPE